MVTNPTVTGHRVHRGRVVGRGCWEPILDEATWQAVKAKLAAPRVVRRKDGFTYPVGSAHVGNPGGRRYVLTGGLARCGAAVLRWSAL
jgi:site-specific DNA recombinase